MLDVVHRNVLERPQRAHGRHLRLGHSLNPRDIKSLVGPVAPQHPQLVAALEIPYLDSTTIAATGQSPAIGAHSERLDRTLMPLSHRQALPTLHVPPAQGPIAAATDQYDACRTPGQRVHDLARLAQGVQALSTVRIPDEELPTASTPAATGQPRPIRTPCHAHDHATMPLQRSSRSEEHTSELQSQSNLVCRLLL